MQIHLRMYRKYFINFPGLQQQKGRYVDFRERNKNEIVLLYHLYKASQWMMGEGACRYILKSFSLIDEYRRRG
jgi:hypothetical protein